MKEISQQYFIISNGNMYQYLCGEKQSATFRALYRGYNHWASGRVEKIEVNINDPSYCFVRCVVIPLMKNWYLQSNYFTKEGFRRVWRNKISLLSMCCWVSTMAFIIIIYFYSLSATCVHVSAILHALVSITSSLQPNPSSVVKVENDADAVVSPTSLLNSWKPPRKRKESTLMMSQVKFEKHVYGKERQYDVQALEMFDLRPTKYRGTATASLNKFIEITKGRCYVCLYYLMNLHECGRNINCHLQKKNHRYQQSIIFVQRT